MKAFSGIPSGVLANIRYVLFDIDDTITEDGYLLPESFDTLWQLSRRGYITIPVTGRPAGWCDMIARQWPVSAVVGENGAFSFHNMQGKLSCLYHPEAPEPQANKVRLEAMAQRALRHFPGLRLAKDQPYRLFDVALDFAEEEPKLGLEVARQVKAFCEAEGAVAKVSSIHVNSWYGNYDKLSMAEHVLTRLFGYNPQQDQATVLYFGDSPNDEPMFRHFSNSCGVANVRAYAELMEWPPVYVTEQPCGYGFAEACKLLLASRPHG